MSLTRENKLLKLGFIGAGTVGTALALGLGNNGQYTVVGVSSRSQASAQNLARLNNGCQVFNNNQDVANIAELAFITTPDDAIGPVASQIRWQAGQSIVHCSGALAADVLEPARKSGASVGTFHPLQTFASVDQAIKNLPGSTFALEAEEPLLTTLKDMVTTLGGHYLVLPAGDKVIYHAAAVIACNYLVTLVKLATDLYQTFNITPEQATQALLPLLRGTINNIETAGIPQCLTGPIARGDMKTISNHINALRKAAPDILPAYQELGRQTIPIALAKGKVNGDKARELQAMLSKE